MTLGGELRCPACGEASHEHARFCTACGTPLPVRCPDCNELNSRGARFCAQCGTRLPDAPEAVAKAASAAERRQLSVMFCDLVDSTPLSGRLDPEDLAEVIRVYQARVAGAIARFGGYIARYVGDGVLSYFGWPEGREADAERSVRAALAVAAAVAETPVRGERLQARIGIATGIVVVGETVGSGEALQQTAIGETPNLAARLQAIAETDGIVIDDATRRLIGGLFTCRDLGELALRGFRAPVRAWRVLGESALDDRFAARQAARLVRFVDREEEFALLLRRWQQARAANGQLVLLTGEPGIGKSRLVAELRARLRGEPHTSLRYFCSPYQQASPLHPVIARWEQEAGFDRRDGPADKVRKLAAVLQRADIADEDAALIADLLSVPSGDAWPSLDLSPQRKKQRTFEALMHRLAVLARQQAVLMVVEDAHWIDPSSLELLDRTIGLLPDLPVLLIVTFRPEFVPPWVGRANATFITLTRLSQSDSMRLATEVMIGHDLSPAPLNRIVSQSDGVPLFIEELTKAVLEQTVAQPDEPAMPAIPDSLQALLTLRLDRLPAAKRVAQIGATIGREFSHTLLAAVADMPEQVLADGLDELVGGGFASRRGGAGEAVYTFRHALVQEAIYDSLLRRRRVEIHTGIVAAAEHDASLGIVEPGLLGHHCAQAGLLAKAASYYRIAGGRSAERAAVAETRTHLERGLRFARNLPDGADRFHLEAELQIALGRILMATSGPNDPEADAAFQSAAAVARKLGNAEMQARALYALGIIAETRAELRSTRAIGEELYALATASGNTGIAIAAGVRLGIVGYYRGDFPAARDHLAEALALCATGRHELRDTAIASDPHVAEAYLSVTLAHLGEVESALAHGRSAMEGARRSGSASPAYALVLSVWSRTLEVLRDEDGCAECAAMLVALGEEQGLAFLLAVGRSQLGWITARRGDVDKGLSLLAESVSTLRQSGARIRPEVAKYLLADILALAGRRTEALAALEEILAFSRDTGAGWLDAELFRRKGELLAGSEADAAAAEDAFRRAIDIARGQSARLFELRATVGLARLWMRREWQDAAVALLRPIYVRFAATPDISDARDARALLSEMDATLL